MHLINSFQINFSTVSSYNDYSLQTWLLGKIVFHFLICCFLSRKQKRKRKENVPWGKPSHEHLPKGNKQLNLRYKAGGGYLGCFLVLWCVCVLLRSSKQSKNASNQTLKIIPWKENVSQINFCFICFFGVKMAEIQSPPFQYILKSINPNQILIRFFAETFFLRSHFLNPTPGYNLVLSCVLFSKLI